MNEDKPTLDQIRQLAKSVATLLLGLCRADEHNGEILWRGYIVDAEGRTPSPEVDITTTNSEHILMHVVTMPGVQFIVKLYKKNCDESTID